MDEWDGLEGDDVLEQGDGQVPRWLAALERLQRPGWITRRGWRPSRGAVILGAAGLVLGLIAGYAVGYRGAVAGRSPHGAALASRTVRAFGAATATASGSSSVSDHPSASDSPPVCGSVSAPASPP